MTFPPPLPLADAQTRLLDMIAPLGAETLPVEQCLGRYLAAPLISSRTQPSADLSAMDGYAMRIDDLSGPWSVVGESAAGHPFSGHLQAGEAIRISTGAHMPDGDCAMLIQENAAREGDTLRLTDGEPTPRHIRREGFDFSAGDTLLEAGRLIGAAQIALALSGGHGSLPVSRLPTLAILDSGDELALDPENCGAHQIPASNGAMLGAMTSFLSGNVTRLGPVADRMDAMIAALERAGEADIIVSSGGASVGDHDLVRPALEEWGATIDFWRVAMKPGKPILVARRGKQIILGLPGNPTSSYVTAFAFLLPLLRKLAGAGSALPAGQMMPLGAGLPATGTRLEFVRARLDGGVVFPIDEQDSSALVALASADALVMRQAHSETAAMGDQVEIFSLSAGGMT